MEYVFVILFLMVNDGYAKPRFLKHLLFAQDKRINVFITISFVEAMRNIELDLDINDSGFIL